MALASFFRLNKIVWVQPPASDGTAVTRGPHSSLPSKALESAAPQTILFLSWGDANPRYIEKYTRLYKDLYPGSKTILVTTGMADFFYRPERTQQKLVEPVVKMLRESAEDTLLVHIMSNAGSKRWCTINKSYFQATGRTLSNAVTIIDSAPGRSRFRQTWAAFSRSLPRALLPRLALGFIFGVILCLMHLWKLIVPSADLSELVREQLNDTTASVKGVRRCYIYSEEDDIIGWEDVEEHAGDAQGKGWAVELVKFPGSTHVGHFKKDPERYRETIQRTWSGK